MHDVWVIDIDSLWITLMGGHVTGSARRAALVAILRIIATRLVISKKQCDCRRNCDNFIFIYLSLFCLDKILWKYHRNHFVLWSKTAIIQLLPTRDTHFRAYQIYLFTAQSHVTAHQRDSQAVNVNHPDLMHRVQCKIFKLLYLCNFLTDLLRVFEQNSKRN